jgi:hypothetical protein
MFDIEVTDTNGAPQTIYGFTGAVDGCADASIYLYTFELSTPFYITGDHTDYLCI